MGGRKYFYEQTYNIYIKKVCPNVRREKNPFSYESFSDGTGCEKDGKSKNGRLNFNGNTPG